MKIETLIKLVVILTLAACSAKPTVWENINEEGAFVVHRRQSPIGEESYKITSTEDSIIVTSLQGENERGRISGVLSELRLTKDLEPVYYSSQRISGDDTTNVLKVVRTGPKEVSVKEKFFDEVIKHTSESYFPLHSNIPAGIEIMLYHYYFKHGKKNITTLPRGEVSINHTGKDIVKVGGKEITLDRYVTEGINWGGRTVWLDENRNLIALVKANTQIREMVRVGYEEALPTFIAGNVTEQIAQLTDYTARANGITNNTIALVGGNVVDGLSETTQENMTVLIENGTIKTIGKADATEIPDGTKIIDVKGKTLIPGLWDMHAHSNQVQWAPTYLAGGVTTIRDNGNEVEFATAFRDGIAEDGLLGPDILLAGMTDGPGIRGNGIIRARSVEEAKEVVAMYHENGYKQIKVYTSIEQEILPVLAEEAHKMGMTVTGHVPALVDNANKAVEDGMDMLSHYNRILAALFPDRKVSELLKGGRYYLARNEITDKMVNDAIAFYLKHGTVLDPTLGMGLIRSLPRGERVETLDPDVGRMAYELFESKRFRAGSGEKFAAAARQDVIRATEVIGKFFKAGLPIVAGTDNHTPGFGLFLELETYHKYGGLSPFECIQTATIIPAKAMGMGDVTGTLEAGKQADIAILDENPLEDINNIRSVSAVMTNGSYYESENLWPLADFKLNRE